MNPLQLYKKLIENKISFSQYVVLTLLRNGESFGSRVSQELGVSAASVFHLVEGLVERKFVEKVIPPNGRAVPIKLTSLGKALLKELEGGEA